MQPATQNVYAIVLRYPESNSINLYSIKSFVTDKTKVKMLGYEKELKVRSGWIRRSIQGALLVFSLSSR